MKNKLKAALLFVATMGISGMCHSLDSTADYPFQPDIKTDTVEKTCSDISYVNGRILELMGNVSLRADDYEGIKEVLGPDYDEYIGVKFQRAIYRNTALNYYYNSRRNQDHTAVQKAQEIMACAGVSA